MATKVREGDFIQMTTGLAGHHFSWAPRQVLEVGKEIDIDFASALVNEPADDPRAELLDEAEALRIRANPNVDDPSEAPPSEGRNDGPPPPEPEPEPEQTSEEEETVEEETEEGETRDVQGEMEQATSPAAEVRETATQKRRRARTKPPKPDADSEDADSKDEE